MSDWAILFSLTLLTGLSMAGGALIALVEHISNRWLETELRHSIIAFGGGLLIAAVALVLIPEGMHKLTIFTVVFCFAGGGLFFMILDRILETRKEGTPQLIAMLLDFIPEVMAVGALYLLDRHYAILLAILIILQNLPEGFNAFLELRANTQLKGWTIITAFLAMSFIGPIAGLLGYFYLSELPSLTSAVMLFASGGILYLIFQDIAPQAKLKYHWAPSLGAVAGFLLGMIGKMLIVH
ncbi:MAG: hypothetical protein WAM28_08145 [Chlamydiales bacterium]